MTKKLQTKNTKKTKKKIIRKKNKTKKQKKENSTVEIQFYLEQPKEKHLEGLAGILETLLAHLQINYFNLAQEIIDNTNMGTIAGYYQNKLFQPVGGVFLIDQNSKGESGKLVKLAKQKLKIKKQKFTILINERISNCPDLICQLMHSSVVDTMNSKGVKPKSQQILYITKIYGGSKDIKWQQFTYSKFEDYQLLKGSKECKLQSKQSSLGPYWLAFCQVPLNNYFQAIQKLANYIQ